MTEETTLTTDGVPAATPPESSDLLQSAVGAARGHDLARALNLFERALESSGLEAFSPLALSYYGLSAAIAGKRLRAGIHFCELARERDASEPFHVVNQVRIYLAAGKRRSAVELLESSLEEFPENPDLKDLRTKFGKRRAPVFGSLARKHPLNRLLGHLRPAPSSKRT